MPYEANPTYSVINPLTVSEFKDLLNELPNDAVVVVQLEDANTNEVVGYTIDKVSKKFSFAILTCYSHEES